MRNGQNGGAGLLTKRVQRLPQVFRVLAVELRKGHRAIGDARISSKDHIPVQVISTDGGPFVTDDGGEGPRIVVGLGGFQVLIPHRLHEARMHGNAPILIRVTRLSSF